MGATRTALMLIFAAAAGLTLAGCGPDKPFQAGGQAEAGGGASIGGPFQLVDEDGRARDQRLLEHRWSAVFFGYTYCPDVCPTTLQTLALAKAKLGAAGKDLQVVFISVDPDRDTPAQLKAYLATPAFPRPTVGLTGSPAQIAATAKAYRAFYQKEGSGPGYSVSHSAIIYLMNPLGKFDRVVTESLTPEEMASQFKDAMRTGPKAGV